MQPGKTVGTRGKANPYSPRSTTLLTKISWGSMKFKPCGGGGEHTPNKLNLRRVTSEGGPASSETSAFLKQPRGSSGSAACACDQRAPPARLGRGRWPDRANSNGKVDMPGMRESLCAIGAFGWPFARRRVHPRGAEDIDIAAKPAAHRGAPHRPLCLVLQGQLAQVPGIHNRNRAVHAF